MSRPRRATLYRMVLPDHTCPFGVRAKMLLEQNGYEVGDHVLGSREDVDRFKSEQDVTTTPLIFIDDRKIGGSRELERHLAEG